MRTFILSLLTFVSVNVFAHYTFKADIPKNTFSYETVTPEQGKVEYVTDGIVITFPDFIGHVNSDAIFILYKNGEPIAPMYAEKAPENGKSIILKFKNIDSGTLFAEGGEYTINFPEKIVYNAFYGLDEERYNPAFTLTYSVLKNTFNYETVTPAQGKVEYVTDGIVITFPKLIGYVNSDVNLTLKKDGVAKAPMYAEIDTENGHNVVLKFKNISGAMFTETGTYTIDFPEKIVYNAFYGYDDECYNPAFTLTYNIGANEPEITPVVELIAELSPATVARNTEKLTLKFISDTPVVLANTTAAYFADKEGKDVGTASITAVEGKDNEFTVSLVGLVDGTYTLVIPDGMFTTEKDDQTVHVAVLGEMTFTIDVTEAFITEFNPAIYNDKYGYFCDTFFNDFILYSNSPMFVDETKKVQLVEFWNTDKPIREGHMELKPGGVEGCPYACQFIFETPIVAGELEAGQYTIKIEEATVGDANFGKYLADPTSVKKSECKVNPEYKYSFFVDNDKAEDDDEQAELVVLEAGFIPKTVESSTDTLLLKFISDEPVRLANPTAAYFKDKDGNMRTATIKAMDGSDIDFIVSWAGLDNGMYDLWLPEATFTTEKDGKTAHVGALKLTFTIDISEADKFKEEFYPAIYNDKYDYIFDTDLNNFILVSEAPMFVDGTKAVKLVDYWDSSNVIRVGHMQSIAVEGWPYACKFVFDKPIVAGELEAGHYSIKIEEATIGDANFGKYLADPTSVKKSECNVNPRFTFTYDVDNDKAAEDEEPVEIVVLEAGFIPKTIESSTDTLLLKFISDEPVRLANSAAAYFKDKDGNMRTATIKAMDGSDIDFIVSWAGLDNGMYDLWLPEATFTTEKDGKTAHVGALKLTFTIDISEADKFKEEFYPAIYNDKYGYIFDTFFNDFILISEAPMFVDETKEVQLVEFWNADISIRKGHMQPIELEGWPYACKFIFDKPIKTGELKAGQYTIILEEATVGDENFGKYLADHTSVKKSECNVNPRFTFNYNVDNKATAITDINADDNAEKVIYTITGRRIKNMNAPGIYIVNGKKVIKK